MLNPLLDKDFLIQLDENRSKETFARITSLTFDELPLEYIEGKVINGSINVDGTSSIRRTFSLTMVSQDVNISNTYWGLSTKMRLEVGIKNSINSIYPEIIWFPQGTYVITQFSTNLTTSGYTISVSGKDKGCLLNGDIGGQIYASVDFGKREDVVNTFEKFALSQSIYSAGFYYISLEDFKKYYINELMESLLGTSTPTDEQVIDRLGLIAYKYSENGKYYILDTGIAWSLPATWDDTMAISNADFATTLSYYNGTAQNQSIVPEKKGFNPFINYYQKFDNVIYTELELKDIIKESVHAYAKEPFHNIIINDLDEYGLELMQYNGDLDVYLLKEASDDSNVAYTWKFLVDGNKTCYLADNTPYQLKDFADPTKPLKEYDRVLDFLNQDATAVYFVLPNEVPAGHTRKSYNVCVVKTGGTIGYRVTPLTYAGDLITGLGDTLATMLDKIKAMLGDYEYFYDVEGHFVFQRKKAFVNTSWNSLITTEGKVIAEPASQTSAVTYNFEGNYLLSAIQNTPVLNNLKNDYSIWGKRKGLSGEDIPIHLRYAIQRKPYYYKSPYKPRIFVTDEYVGVKNIKEQQQAKTKQELRNFVFHYQDDIPDVFEKPVIDSITGEISPGWWDIRDFYDYYGQLTGDANWATGTMKWYSSNDASGCVPYKNIVGGNSNSYCWLLGIRRYKPSVITGRTTLIAEHNGQERRYFLETNHGLSALTSNYMSKTFWRDYYDATEGKWKWAATQIHKDFTAPYSSCSDNHTYRFFLQEAEDFLAPGELGEPSSYDYSAYLFYNPQFPFAEAIEAASENAAMTELEAALQELTNDTLDGVPYGVELVDWRELIYQMADDYFKHNSDVSDDFLSKVNNCNCIADNIVPGRQIYLYPGGYTGYEQYYTDIQGFWRQVYCPPYDWNKLGLRFEVSDGKYVNIAVPQNGQTYTMESIYQDMQIETAYCSFYLPAIMKQALTDEIQVDPNTGELMFDDDYFNNIEEAHGDYLRKLRALYEYHGRFKNEDDKQEFLNTYFRNDYKYWCIDAVQDPSKLNFWIDFLGSGELAQFDVQLVGARQKTVNDDKVTSIYLKEVPNLIFKKPNEEIIDKMTGYTYVNLSNSLVNLFTISTQGKSAKDKLDELLYEYSYCIENITITSVPIYYLQPNTRIYVYDDSTKIDGEYIMTRFSLPLNYNGTMQITANKAPERIY